MLINRSFLFLCLLMPAFCKYRCPAGWSVYLNRCYYMNDKDGSITWSDAKTACEDKGGMLVVIDSSGVNDYVTSLTDSSTQQLFWIGLHDVVNEDAFIWVDGVFLDDYGYVNWGTDQPDNYNDDEDCVDIQNGKWNDLPCSSTQPTGYICQTEKDVEVRCDEDDGWASVNDKCYKYFSDEKKWQDAVNYCRNGFDAELIEVENQIVQDHVTKLTLNSAMWIGLSDKLSGQSGVYKWVDGSIPTYEHWGPSQPATVFSPNCVKVKSSDDGLWTTEDCAVTNSFCCGKPEGSCAPGWKIYKGQCYQFNTYFPATWTDGKHTCEVQAAHLVTVNNQGENDFLVHEFGLLNEVGINNVWIGISGSPDGGWDTAYCFTMQPFVCEIPVGQTIVPLQPGYARIDNIQDKLLIGFHDTSLEGEFEWVDGSPVDFTNWYAGTDEPNDYGGYEDCTVLEYDESRLGSWNDLDCNNIHGYICKKQKYEGGMVTTLPKPTPVLNPRCGSGYEFNADTFVCYKYVFDAEVTWEQAEESCRRTGGHLLSIKDNREQIYINGRLYGVNSPKLWIGANDRSSEGGWEWSDGTPFAYFNWDTDEPNDYNLAEDCTEIVVVNGLWNDHDCSTNKIGYICENKGSLIDYFNVYHDSALASDNIIENIEGVYPDYCADVCAYDPGRACKSFDYDKVNLACNLYTSNLQDGSLSTYPNDPYDYYEVVSFPEPETTTTLAPGSRCQNGWTSYRSSCYILMYTHMVWLDSRDTCRQLGGDLVTISDQNENDFVISMVHSSCEEYHSDGTSDEYGYKFVPTPVTNTRVTFDVMAGSDVHVSLSEFPEYSGEDQPMYQIVIGGWSNSRSVIRLCTACDHKADEQTPGILSATEWRGFWIIFTNGFIRVGRQGEGAFMEWQDPNPLPVYYVGYSTGYGHTGEFRFCTAYSENDSIWIGLNDLRHQRLFEWSDLSQVTYTNWNNGEPNNWNGRDEQCVNMLVDGSAAGLWNDELCQYYLKAVCEKDKEVLPPTTPGSSIDLCDANIVASLHAAMFSQHFDFFNDIKSRRYVSPNERILPIDSDDPRLFRYGTQSDGWFGHGSSCYKFNMIPIQWNSAQIECETYQGNLVSINDNVEQSFLNSKLSQISNGESYWVGLNDLGVSGVYEWSDGQKVTYTNWGVNQPDSRTGDCVSVTSGTLAGLWYGTPCGDSMHYICERLKNGYTLPPPEPKTTPSDAGCSAGWIGYGDSCFLIEEYSLEEDRLMWSDALERCQQQGGDLASFHSAEEELHVWEKSGVNDWANAFWIGLNDVEDESGFVWSDGSAVNYVDWHDGEPNGGTLANCIEVFFHESKSWNDQVCDRPRNWICKIPKGVPPVTKFPVPDATRSPLCGSDLEWYLYNDYCYYVSVSSSEGLDSWQDANSFCNAHASYLASIHSQEEQQLIHYGLGQRGAWAGWIGLRENSAATEYVWSDSSALTYTNWAPNEPNDAHQSEQCVEIRTSDGMWNDNNCGDRLSFACKKHMSDINPITSAVTTPVYDAYCPPGFLQHNNKCYSFHGQSASDVVDWDTARERCRNDGGDLATIHSKEQQAYITSRLRDIDYAMWIGLNDVAWEGQFRWSDGSEVKFVNWAEGEPNGGDVEDCTELHFRAYGGLWNDAACSSTAGYICQADKDSSYSPSVTTPNYCKPGYIQYWNACYKVLSGSHTFNGAQSSCQQDSTELVSIMDVYENAFIEYHMLSIGSPFWIGLNDLEVSNKQPGIQDWIGLNDLESDGVYKWTDGSPVLFTAWGDAEPSKDPYEGCVQMTTQGPWDDTDCSLGSAAMCKYWTGMFNCISI
uniref:Macrophage mannose receptor 1-like n=1 Tax=Saccoglossus kowalevskii TaxID=10224 RepID=A0ABM0M0M8_SACKO|nr:PREDICTED: macrophage mannose receptor 1-like [Saccoglossus kowalevskii]